MAVPVRLVVAVAIGASLLGPAVAQELELHGRPLILQPDVYAFPHPHRSGESLVVALSNAVARSCEQRCPDPGRCDDRDLSGTLRLLGSRTSGSSVPSCHRAVVPAPADVVCSIPVHGPRRYASVPDPDAPHGTSGTCIAQVCAARCRVADGADVAVRLIGSGTAADPEVDAADPHGAIAWLRSRAAVAMCRPSALPCR